MQDSRPHFAAQNSHGHGKEFLWKLSTIWARALKNVRQPCPRSMGLGIPSTILFLNNQPINESSFRKSPRNLKFVYK
jgi:hypothetical protein